MDGRSRQGIAFRRPARFAADIPDGDLQPGSKASHRVGNGVPSPASRGCFHMAQSLRTILILPIGQPFILITDFTLVQPQSLQGSRAVVNDQ